MKKTNYFVLQLQYYDRALDCLPSPKSSEDPDNAGTAYVELLLAR